MTLILNKIERNIRLANDVPYAGLLTIINNTSTVGI